MYTRLPPHIYTYAYIYTKVSGSGERLVHGNLRPPRPRGLSCFPVLWSLRPAQNRPARAQSRSEPLRIAQSVPRAAQSRPERSLRAVRGTALGRPEPLRIAKSGRSRSPRAAQNRSERAQSCSEPPRAVRGNALGRRVTQSAPRAALSEEPLRIARSVPRAAQSRSGLLEKPIGELGVTCTLHIRCSVLLHLVPSSPCMYMHGFALVYIYIYMAMSIWFLCL